MRYYDEEVMKDIRTNIDDTVLQWPDVSTKKMFGCPCYKHKEKLFCFLVTDGIVIMKTTTEDKKILENDFGSFPFQAQTRTMKSWLTIPLHTTEDIEQTISYVRKSYELVVTH